MVANRDLLFQPCELPRRFIKSSYYCVNLSFEIRGNFNLFSEFRFLGNTSIPLKLKRFLSVQIGTFIKTKKTSKPTLTLFSGFLRSTKVIKKKWLVFQKEIWTKRCSCHKMQVGHLISKISLFLYTLFSLKTCAQGCSFVSD